VSRRIGVAAGAAVLTSGTLFLLGTGLHPVASLTWLAPVPVLVLAPLVRRRLALVVAGTAYLLGLAGEARYLLAALETPPPLVALLLVVITLVFVGIVAVFRALAVRGRWWSALLSVPAAWVSAEYLFAVATPYGANWSLAPTQSNLSAVTQIASVTGAGGVTFLVAGTASALAVAILVAASRPRLAASVVVVVGLLGGSVLAFGASRLRVTSTESLRVAVVAAPGPGYQPEVATPDGARLVAADLAWLRSPALRSAEIVVFPETDVEVRATDMPGLAQAFGRVARERNVTVVLGVARMLDDGRRNTALVFPADGSSPLTYDKQHPIVGQEAGTVPGARDLLFGPADVRVGVAVCADLAHPELARSYAAEGARLLAVPALDFGVDAWSQSRVQIMRGLESGFATARASRDGYLTIADAQGRILAETRASRAATVSLVADVPMGPGATTYARLGDWFSWLCLLLTALALLQLSLPRSSRSRARDTHDAEPARLERVGGRSAV
jgi:apolipoprotein N-acyltransferase